SSSSLVRNLTYRIPPPSYRPCFRSHVPEMMCPALPMANPHFVPKSNIKILGCIALLLLSFDGVRRNVPGSERFPAPVVVERSILRGVEKDRAAGHDVAQMVAATVLGLIFPIPKRQQVAQHRVVIDGRGDGVVSPVESGVLALPVVHSLAQVQDGYRRNRAERRLGHPDRRFRISVRICGFARAVGHTPYSFNTFSILSIVEGRNLRPFLAFGRKVGSPK